MGKMDDAVRVQVESRAALQAWLLAHHGTSDGCWLVMFKKHCGDRHLPWRDLVRGLLCFGWIDSRKRRLDDDRIEQWVCPRRPGGPWSALNKRHIAELREEGAMRAAGEAAIARAIEDGSWTLLDDIEAGIVPPDLQAALDAEPAGAAGWGALTEGQRRGWLWQLKTAKRPATRAARLGKAVAQALAAAARATVPPASPARMTE